MADFSTPFAQDAERRNPTASEKTGGFPCGPANQALFNGLFHSLQAEIGNVITAAGVPHDANSNDRLQLAIQAFIDAATGGGETSQFLLLNQARSRLPIFPETDSADGKINVYSPSAGTVRLPGGVIFLHRGVFPVSTDETNFLTDASKTYHLRWSMAGGFELHDLAGTSYNPSSLNEVNESFDSSYDDMLISRVTTNSSNIATITNLSNRAQLSETGEMVGKNWRNPSTNESGGDFELTIDWARTPKFRAFSLYSRAYGPSGSDNDLYKKDFGGAAASNEAFYTNRYGSKFGINADHTAGMSYLASLMA